MAVIISIFLVFTSFKESPSTIIGIISLFPIHISDFSSIYCNSVRSNTISHRFNKVLDLIRS